MKLSTRESQIVELLQHGLTNKQIGEKLCVSQHTVRDYISRLLLRFDVSNRAALAAVGARYAASPTILRRATDRRVNADRRASDPAQ